MFFALTDDAIVLNFTPSSARAMIHVTVTMDDHRFSLRLDRALVYFSYLSFSPCQVLYSFGKSNLRFDLNNQTLSATTCVHVG